MGAVSRATPAPARTVFPSIATAAVKASIRRLIPISRNTTSREDEMNRTRNELPHRAKCADHVPSVHGARESVLDPVIHSDRFVERSDLDGPGNNNFELSDDNTLEVFFGTWLRFP